MKADQIQVGKRYLAKVNNNLSVVRVDAIREVCKLRGRFGAQVWTDAKVYHVTNISTGRTTVFRSASKFRFEVTTSTLETRSVLPIRFNESDCGGTFDGFSVSSDADSGL